MKLVAKIESEIELMHISGKQVVLSDNITKEFDEFSEEYKVLCDEYKNLVGFEREENKDEFDKKLLMVLVAEIKLEKQKALDNILEVVNKIYQSPQKYDGYVQIQGATIRVKDFSYFRIKNLTQEFIKDKAKKGVYKDGYFNSSNKK